MASFGLIAGISLPDQRRLPPGMVMDAYIARQRYDDTQHGIRRKRQAAEL